MKKILAILSIVLVSVMVFGGCMTKNAVLIDWVDFVKWDGVTYEKAYNDGNAIVVPAKLIGERIGTVEKNAPSEVDSPDYKPEDGMASFLPVGTEFFVIDGYNSKEYIAVYTDGVYTLYKTPNSESINFDDTDNASDRTSDKAEDADELKPTKYEVVNNLEGVNMSIKEGTISPTGLTLVLKNDSESQCIYGEFFILEKKLNEKWYEVPVIIEGDYGFRSIGYELSPGDSKEWKVDWNWLYGSLDKGEYRIVKDILDFRGTGDYDTYYLAVEFTID